MSYVILESPRLLFRQHTIADKDGYCAMEMDADVRRYVGGRPRRREEAEKRFEGMLEPPTSSLSMWATEIKATGEYIGRCGIYPHFDADSKPIPGEASLGLYIAHKFWNKGYATEAGEAFIKFGFNELKLKRIVAMIQAENTVSIHVVEKSGFILERTEQGLYRQFYHYELKKQEAG